MDRLARRHVDLFGKWRLHAFANLELPGRKCVVLFSFVVPAYEPLVNTWTSFTFVSSLTSPGVRKRVVRAGPPTPARAGRFRPPHPVIGLGLSLSNHMHGVPVVLFADALDEVSIRQ